MTIQVRKQLSFGLIAMLTFSLGVSCKRRGATSPNSISRKELNQIMKVDSDAKGLVKRLEEHFHEEGYTFTLAYQTSGTGVSNLLQRPTLLICDGTTDEESASIADSEIRTILTEDELEGLDRLYQVAPLGDSWTYRRF